MSGHEFTDQARRDLLEIWSSVADFSVRAADRLIARIRKAIDNLVSMPEMGQRYEDCADPELRVWPVRHYLVFYRPTPELLQIIRIVSGYRDLEKIFQPR